MLKIIEDRIKQREERLEVARAYLKRLSAHVGKLTGIVYGSTARGDFKDWSDIDIVVVAEKFPEAPMKRLNLLYDFSEGRVEPKGFTVEEFKDILNSSFGKLLREEGIPLRDDLNVFKGNMVDPADAACGILPPKPSLSRRLLRERKKSFK